MGPPDMHCPYVAFDPCGYLLYYPNTDGFNFWTEQCIYRQEMNAPVCRNCVYGRGLYKNLTGREILLEGGKSAFCVCGRLSLEKWSLKELGIQDFPMCEECATELINNPNKRKSLSSEQKREIVYLYFTGRMKQKELAEMFSRSQFTISFIINEESRKFL